MGVAQTEEPKALRDIPEEWHRSEGLATLTDNLPLPARNKPLHKVQFDPSNPIGVLFPGLFRSRIFYALRKLPAFFVSRSDPDGIRVGLTLMPS